ncbi:PRY3 [Symbiodinium sp. CCMP2456]|nr:PRY3 [Symbiodinium sp. CCMP2456]
MDGMIVMFAPGKGDREAGIKAIKDFGIPNAFLDLTMKASVRFKQSDFVSSLLDTVEILDEIYTTDMGFDPNPWRTEEKINCDPGKGEISVNLVDLMEFLDLKPDGTMDDKKMKEAEDAFRTWKESDAFRRRVVGILTEEGRGVANYKDYGALSRWLRKHFPQDEEYRVLVHAHGGDGNTQDAASVEAVLEGANGVWAAVIPQAAQSGHNSSMVFLDNMLQMGNGHVLDDFWLHQAAQCARHIYSLNFNSYAIPDDCPIWGARVDQLLHTAFSTVSGEEWRQRRCKYYDIWGDDARAQIGRMTKSTDLQHKVAMLRSLSRGGNYRISPLVSDVETWRKRIVELGAAVVGPRGRAGDHVKEVRDLGFALMNAGIRANMNEAATLKQLWDIATRNKTEKIRCDQVAGYLKAQQHQGEKE